MVFVTITSYKHKGLLRKDGSQNPIMFGPMLLDGTSTFEVYAAFLDHIATAFGSNKQPKLVIGSDEEAALRRAIREKFLNSDKLCTRHLRNNVVNSLKNIVGLKRSDRQHITEAVFGESEAFGADDIPISIVFDQRLKDVKVLVADKTTTTCF